MGNTIRTARQVIGFVLIIGLLVVPITLMSHARDRTVPRRFQRLHPCPATGKITGACPGSKITSSR